MFLNWWKKNNYKIKKMNKVVINSSGEQYYRGDEFDEDIDTINEK